MNSLSKRILVLLLLLLAALPLSGCKNQTDVLKIALDIEDEGRYQELFAEFEAIEGIAIEATYGQDISKLIGTEHEPDIIKTSTVVVLSMQPSLYDLTNLIETDPDISPDMYLDPIIEALTIDDKIYALPTSINTSLLYYNKAMFDLKAEELRTAFGLEATESVYPRPDWTYSDYVLAGVTLSEYTVLPDTKRVYTKFGAETQLTWWGEWLVYVNQMGGSFYEDGSNNHITAVTSEAVIQATTFFRNKSMGDETEKFAPDAVESASSFSFLNGNVAMVFGGHMGDWFSYDTLGLDWDIEVLPRPDDYPNAPSGEIAADAFGISVRSDKKEDAFKFLKYLAGGEGALKMYQYGKVGALKNMETLIASLPEAEQKDINIAAVFDAAETAYTLPREKDFSKVMREMVMTEIYRLMYTGRGSSSDVAGVLALIKNNVDSYYAGLYD
jgi:ABC-type glycerol-3-phosphate transport system substrate-binding protein